MVSNLPFFPNKLSSGLIGSICNTATVMQTMCTNLLFQIGGFNSKQLNQVSKTLFNQNIGALFHVKLGKGKGAPITGHASPVGEQTYSLLFLDLGT